MRSHTDLAHRDWPVGLPWLIPDWRGGRWLAGVIITIALLGLFGILGALQRPYTSPALFFALAIGYIVPVFHYINSRTVTAIDEIGGTTGLDPMRIAAARARIRQKPRIWHVWVVALGLGAGTAHNLLLGVEGALGHGALVLGTFLVWIAFTIAMAGLIDNALQLKRLATIVPVNPMLPDTLRPFATIAVLSTLSIIGAQALFPILILDNDTGPASFVPGFIATLAPMIALAALPVWPLHARLCAAKRDLLRHVERDLGAFAASDSAATAFATAEAANLVHLLTLRREFQRLPEWPFDLGTAGRLGFYLIIPPITWVGAALIERVVDTLF